MNKKCTTIIERKNSHEMISSFNRRDKKYLESFPRDNAFNVSKTLIKLHKNNTFNTIRKQNKIIRKSPSMPQKKNYKPSKQHFWHGSLTYRASQQKPSMWWKTMKVSLMEVVNNTMQKRDDECPTLVFMEHPRNIHHPK